MIAFIVQSFARSAIMTRIVPRGTSPSDLIGHKFDERHGRTGLPFFVARQNLAECIRASTKFPAGVKGAVTDAGLVASTLSLGAGLPVPFTVAGAVARR